MLSVGVLKRGRITTHTQKACFIYFLHDFPFISGPFKMCECQINAHFPIASTSITYLFFSIAITAICTLQYYLPVLGNDII